ncbi:hypothetical protein [Ktedonobacter racemifer]|uniref:hypothetical protein n=1 Tax=Ktedonobacter racemifer TaxID=363277 RepID=UPI00059010A8|nr:hypothetical protein [Ktedonobacter racemifer]
MEGQTGRRGDMARGDCKEDAVFVNENGLEQNTSLISTLSEHPQWISIPSRQASMLRGMRF